LKKEFEIDKPEMNKIPEKIDTVNTKRARDKSDLEHGNLIIPTKYEEEFIGLLKNFLLRAKGPINIQDFAQRAHYYLIYIKVRALEPSIKVVEDDSVTPEQLTAKIRAQYPDNKAIHNVLDLLNVRKPIGKTKLYELINKDLELKRLWKHRPNYYVHKDMKEKKTSSPREENVKPEFDEAETIPVKKVAINPPLITTNDNEEYWKAKYLQCEQEKDALKRQVAMMSVIMSGLYTENATLKAYVIRNQQNMLNPSTQQ